MHRLAGGLIPGASGRIVFFVGAGVSVPSGLPDFRRLSALALEPLLEGVVDEATRNHLAGRSRPEIVLEAAVRAVGPQALGVLDHLGQGAPSPNHFFLAEALRQKHIVATVNLDSLIEYTCQEEGISFALAESEAQFQELQTAGLRDDVGYLLKFHGSVSEAPGMARYATTAATLETLSKGLSESKGHVLEAILRRHDVCFMGYGFRDDFTVVPVIQKTTAAAPSVSWFEWTRDELGHLAWQKSQFRQRREDELKRLHHKASPDPSKVPSDPDPGKAELMRFLIDRRRAYHIAGDSSQFVADVVLPALGVTWRALPARPLRGDAARYAEAARRAPRSAKLFFAATLLERDGSKESARDAVAFFLQAAALPDGSGNQSEAYRRAAEGLRAIGDALWFQEASKAVDGALTAAPDGRAHARALATLANLRRFQRAPGFVAAGLADIGEARKALGDKAGFDRGGVEGFLDQIEALLIFERAKDEEPATALSSLEQAVRLARAGFQQRIQSGEARGAASARNSAGLAMYQLAVKRGNDPGLMAEAASELEATVEFALSIGEHLVVFQASRNLGLCLEETTPKGALASYTIGDAHLRLFASEDSEDLAENRYRQAKMFVALGRPDEALEPALLALRMRREAAASRTGVARGKQTYQVVRILSLLWPNDPNPMRMLEEALERLEVAMEEESKPGWIFADSNIVKEALRLLKSAAQRSHELHRPDLAQRLEQFGTRL